ncbi:GumC family protein [Parapedobacter deserti]|uniref:GumC family protein n=1 Tax=Parapedobacter deserti TaxID=1912957 RepID=A0ABV7JGE7_9SPHI
MIDFKKLLRFFLRYLWLIITFPIVTIGFVYFLVKDMPDSYTSQSLIATNSSEMTRLGTAQQVPRQLYSNMIGMVKMKKVMDAVGYRLALHDLESEGQAFRAPSEKVAALSPTERSRIIDTMRSRLSGGMVNWASDVDTAITDVLESMGYGRDAIADNLNVNRYGESEFIGISFTSENPELSAYVVNTVANEFIRYYHGVIAKVDVQAVSVLDSLLRQKERIMQEKNDQLRDYRSSSGILNSSSHTGMVYQQIINLETSRTQKIAEIESTQGAIRDITARLNDPSEVSMRANISELNNEVILLDGQLEAANRRYIENNFGAAEKRLVDSLQQERRKLVARSATQSLENPQANRTLLQQKVVELQTVLASLRNSVRAIESELALARQRYNAMVPMDAGLKNLERDAELATSEYMEMLNRHNQAGFQSNAGLRLSIVELGLPGSALPSKKLVYMALSGVASAFACLAVLTLLFLLDRKIVAVDQLKSATDGSVLGCLNQVAMNGTSVTGIWREAATNPQFGLYRDLLRSLRFDINRSMLNGHNKILGITSLKSGEGKTFLSASLAYAFAVTGKRVLLIGNDVKGVSDDMSANGKNEKKNKELQEFETFLVKREIQAEDLITVLHRNSKNSSLFELQDTNSLQIGFNTLKEKFDLVIIDIDSFENFNQAKEWLMFADKSICVFESGGIIDDQQENLIAYIQNHPGFIGWVLNKIRVKPALSPAN